MTIRAPFQPRLGTNQVAVVTGVSGSLPIDPEAKSVRLVNSGANLCHIRIGEGAQTATTADLVILANTSIVVQKAEGENTIAGISAAGTTLHVQTGEGGV